MRSEVVNEAQKLLSEIRPQIKIVGSYNGQQKRVKLACTIHHVTWTGQVEDFLGSRPRNCPLCYVKLTPFNAKTYAAKLKFVNPCIEVLEPVINASTPIKHRCKICSTEYDWYPSHTIRSKNPAQCGVCNGTRYSYIGERFGKLTVIKQYKHRNSQNEIQWFCQCDCGNTHYTASRNLIDGSTKSCGCLNHVPKHDMHTTDEYKILQGLLSRCYTKTNKAYHRYGGRGIRVCKRWRQGENGLTGIECFIQDMGKRPSKKHSIDRKNNDGHYTPKNCRWVTKKEQDRNTRRTIWVTYKGKQMSLPDAIEKSNNSMHPTDYQRIRTRIKNQNMTFEEAISF